MRKTMVRFEAMNAGDLFLTDPKDDKDHPELWEKSSAKQAHRLEHGTFNRCGGPWDFLPGDVVTALVSDYTGRSPASR